MHSSSFFFFFLDDVNRAGALQYPHLGGGCENNHLELPVFLKHVAMGYRPEYPPPNGVHNNRFLPPRLLHTVHIQIHTRRAASRGGPGATTVPAAGVGDNQLRPASLEALPLPPVPRHLVAVTCKQGHLWALASPRAPLPSHDPRQSPRHPHLGEQLVRPSASGRRAGAARERRSDGGGGGGGGCSSEPLRRLCGSWWRRWPAWTWAEAASAPRSPSVAARQVRAAPPPLGAGGKRAAALAASLPSPAAPLPRGLRPVGKALAAMGWGGGRSGGGR